MISKVISTESIAQVSAALKRRPVIWDNIHANDYDQRRLFLGPYDCRSTDLFPMLNGILTNPNCEFEPNFIAIHTLASWNRCAKSKHQKMRVQVEAKEKEEMMEAEPDRVSPAVEVMQADSKEASGEMKLDGSSDEGNALVEDMTQRETQDSGTESGMEVESTVSSEMLDTDTVEEYDLQESLKKAVKAWLSDFARPVLAVGVKPKVLSIAASAEVDKEGRGTVPVMIGGDFVQSRVSDETSAKRHRQQDTMKERPQMTEDDVSLLVDLFYLPHQHGPRAVEIMRGFHWLKKHANMSRGPGNEKQEAEQTEGKDSCVSVLCVCHTLF